jgi:hypothetical protein
MMFPDIGAKSCWHDERKWDRGNVPKNIEASLINSEFQEKNERTMQLFIDLDNSGKLD